MSKLKEINGELVINNNVLLTDISGLLDVQGGAGTISVINNKALGEDKPLVGEDYSYGLFPLRYLYEKESLTVYSVLLIIILRQPQI